MRGGFGSVSDIVTDAMTAFGMSADESARFADVLAQASSNSNTNVGMMGETFKYVAPVAGAFGYTVEDVAVATGLMANGIKAEKAGTAMRTMLTNLAKPTKQMQGYMDKLSFIG
ncbi:phage tail tape measure protein [Enterocloster sp.]|uniref:phage tail tape measure protein n=1 Tax=Enterocloster sp. TaxID=2719315 RepID=UPI0039A2EA97